MVVNQRRTDAWNLIGANGSPDATAADSDAARHFAGRDGLSQRSDIVGVIIVGFEFVSSEINDFVARAAKLGNQLFF